MDLDFDIKRSIILAEYIKCWGLPEARSLMTHNDMPVELYLFPGEDMDQVSRVVTIGLSSCKFPDSKTCNNELLMVLPFDVADDQWQDVSQYIFEISNYIVNTLGRNLKVEELFPENLGLEKETAPVGWPKSILFDDPRGEPNELNQFYIGMQHVTLNWVVPIFASEYDLIKTSGIESFDAALADAEVSLVEVRRDACI